MKENKFFLIPMIVSVVLLPCFLAYFLHSEFTKEKEAIRLETKDESFNRFFAVLDTLSHKRKGGQAFPQLFLEKNPSDGGLKYEFKIEAKDSLTSIDSIIASEKSIKINFFEDGSNHLHTPENTIDSGLLEVSKVVIYDDEKTNRFPTVMNKSKKTKDLRIWHNSTDEDSSILGLSNKEIPRMDILKRILPQIFFSLFLLLSVFLAYWFIARSLRNERQLTLMRNNFMSNMSHELKTPVSTIGVALEALSTFDAADNPALRKEYIEISKNEVERLGLLVDKALNISLYEQGQFVFDLQPIDLKKEIEKILRTLKVQLDNQNVTLDFISKGTDFNILVDRTHMVNVIYNLIENGIKYSSTDPEIAIDLKEKNEVLELSIADSGKGIAPEFQDRIFDKFFRVPQGDAHNVKGHGLGLSYVKGVVESMGGSILVKSGLGVGTTFFIKIPKQND